MRYIIPTFAALVLATTLLIAVSPRHERADFTFVNRGSIMTLDPAAMSYMQDIRLGLSIWEGLSTYHPETTDAIPGSAYAPTISEDKRTYTFTIKPEAKWNNGDPVTAMDFAYSWRRGFEPGTARNYAFLFEHIVGVKDYVAWRTAEIERLGSIKNKATQTAERDKHIAEANRRFKEKIGIQPLDDKTLEVTLVRPLPYFLDLTAFATLLPVHSKSIHKFQVIDDNGMIYYDQQWTKPENTFYNGAFYLTEWKFKRHLLLSRNEHYYGAKDVKLRTVELIEVEDANTAWLLYSGGQADWLSSLETDYNGDLIEQSCSPLEKAVNKSGTKRTDIHAFPAYGTYYYDYNCSESWPDGTPNPFLDQRVRQAFSMAVDRRMLVDQVIREGNLIAETFIPPGSIKGYRKVKGNGFDVKRARELLAEAGYPDGKGFPEIVVLFNTGFDHGKIAQAVTGMWSKNLKITSRVQGKETKTFREDQNNTNYIICRASWYGDYADPTTFLDMFETTNSNNTSQFSDPQFDSMMAEAESELDPQKRLDILADAEEYLMSEATPMIPLFHYVNIFAFDSNKIKNLYLTPRIMTVIKEIEVVQ